MPSRRRFLQAAAAGANAAAAQDRPNIDLIRADEHRYDAMGCAGNTVVRTPNMVESIDLTATMLDLADAELLTCRGRSLVPLIKGKGKAREAVRSGLDGHNNEGSY